MFNIWILSQRKVIRTRDVIFDEGSGAYDPHEIDLLQAINEPMRPTTFDVQPLNSLDRIIEMVDSDEEDGLVREISDQSAGSMQWVENGS